MPNSDTPMIIRDVASGGFVWVNRLFTERLGWKSADLSGKALSDWIHEEDRPEFNTALRDGTGRPRSGHLAQEGEPVPLDWTIRKADHGLVALGVLAEEPAKTVENRPVAAPPPGDPLAETLREMALIIEGRHPGRYCSILLLDKERKRVRVGAGPSLPPEYNAAVEGLAIGPSVGSCGSAAYWGRPVNVENIQEEGLWRDLKQYAARAGVAACWSHPITSRSGEVVGALALYNSVPSAPTDLELSALEMAAKMVALTIERGRAEQQLRESEASAQFQARLLSAVTDVTTSFVDKDDFRTAAGRLVRAAMDLTDSASGLLSVVESSDFAAMSDGRAEPGASYRCAFQSGGLSVASVEPCLEEVAASAHPTIGLGSTAQSQRLGSAIRINEEVVAILCVEKPAAKYDDRSVHAMSVLCRAASELFDAYRRQRREAALEDHLRQAAKMEAIGVLAGGIAHDFNNMLTVVQGNAELAMGDLPAGTVGRRLLSRILDASQKSKELCNQMLAYAGRGSQTVHPIELNSLVRELGNLQRAALSKKSRLEYRLAPEAMCIKADRTQINQLVMNLISNAAEALGDNEGDIVVTTAARTYERHELDPLHGGAELEPGEYISMTVRDNGCGMSEETQERIFDPFFTTKLAGRGLGLAAVRGIVRAHGGAIRITSAQNRGTTFTILLPRLRASAELPAVEPSKPASTGPEGQVILVVEDEPAVQEVQAEILKQGGYEVLRASDGKEAVELYEQLGDTIDCVLVDLSMPRLNGEETLVALRKLRSDARVVLTSGFTEQEMLDRSGADGFDAIVQKPFSGPTLLATIRDVLA